MEKLIIGDTLSDDKIPVIKDMHQEIYRAITEGGTLNMNQWHGGREDMCGTMHCRAGWAVHLAGKAGYALETQVGPLFAAMLICNKSSPILVGPSKFYEYHEEAFADVKRCAELEQQHNLGSVAER